MRQAVIGASLGMLAVGLIAPRTAIRSAHALVAIITITVLIVLVQPVIASWEVARARPFAPLDGAPERSIAPAVIVELADEVDRAGGFVSARTRSRITAIAVGRVLDHHHPSSSTSIAPDELHEYFSPTLAAIVAGSEDAERIGVGELDSLLSELERL